MDIVAPSMATKLVTLMGIVAGLPIVCYLINAIYNIFFHPLRHIPGPKLNAVTRMVWIRHMLAGTTVTYNQALHQKYGTVVRFSPNEVSFTSAETAWPDIYGLRTGKLKGHLNMPKDPAWYPVPYNGIASITTEKDADHSRTRKILSHAFSEKALMAQENLIQNYVDQLISRLREVTSKTGKSVDMAKWYNWTTFDIIADLLLGEPFGCLQDLATHKYVYLLFKGAEAFRFFYILEYFPWAKYVGAYLGIFDSKTVQESDDFGAWAAEKTEKRCARDTQRPDFMTYILTHNATKGDETALTQAQLNSNVRTMLAAGSETTATLLSGVTFALLKNPAVFQKLKDEVRNRWSNYADITFEEVNRAPYLLAVLNEALRFFPPVPLGFQRRTAAGGEVVSGFHVPENTPVSVSQYSAYHDENNFKDADLFVPERWTGAKRYEGDRRSALQPFSFGPRNCLGKNMAHAESRLILAKVVWSFDLELDAKSQNWMADCTCLTLWKKPELAVHVREVVRE